MDIGVDGRTVRSVLVIFKLHRRFILLYGPIVLLLPLSLLKHGSLAIPFPTIPFAFVQMLLRPEMVYAIWAKMFRSLASTHPTGKKTTQTFKGTKMILVPKKVNDVLVHLARFQQQLNVLRRKQTVAIGLRHLLNPENVNPNVVIFRKLFHILDRSGKVSPSQLYFSDCCLRSPLTTFALLSTGFNARVTANLKHMSSSFLMLITVFLLSMKTRRSENPAPLTR